LGAAISLSARTVQIMVMQELAAKQKNGGMMKGVGRLQLVTVDNAGHDAPSSQPEACLELVNRWMVNEKLKSGANQ
jgi:carboxypeptidase C (cathepsin A)